jgi:hypothetical protein
MGGAIVIVRSHKEGIFQMWIFFRGWKPRGINVSEVIFLFDR